MLFMCHLINSGVALRSRRHCFPILQGRDLNLREQRTPRVAVAAFQPRPLTAVRVTLAFGYVFTALWT